MTRYRRRPVLVHTTVDAVELWSRAKRLKLNVLKCDWVSSISLLGSNLAFNKTPVILGVDRTLSFGPRWMLLKRRWALTLVNVYYRYFVWFGTKVNTYHTFASVGGAVVRHSLTT